MHAYSLIKNNWIILRRFASPHFGRMVRMICFDLNKVVLDVCEPRQYSGKEAHSKLNKLARTIHENITNICALHAKTDLLVKFYDYFDEACYHIIKGSHWLGKNLEVISSVEKAPSILRYLLEVTIFAGGSSGNTASNDEVVTSLIGAADWFLALCNHSDFLFYSNFLGGFAVSNQGEIKFTIDEKMKEVSRAYLEEHRFRRISIKLEKPRIKTTKDFGQRFQSFTQPYDDVFENKYGVKLSTVAEVIEYTILKIVKNLHGGIRISHNILIKRLRKGLKLDKKTLKIALGFFEIDKNFLSEDWQYYRFFNVPVSVSRRPIIRLYGKMGRKGELLFGPNALMRAFVLQFTDIQRGIVKLEVPGELSSEERGRKFEQGVRTELRKYDFEVRRFTEPPSNVGEIDAIAVREDRGILLVIEAKSPKMDLSPKDMKWQLEKARKWCNKLDKKVRWVDANMDLIATRLQFDKNRIQDIIGIIVSRVPWYYEKDLSFKIATIQELKLLLSSFL